MRIEKNMGSRIDQVERTRENKKAEREKTDQCQFSKLFLRYVIVIFFWLVGRRTVAVVCDLFFIAVL